MPRPRRFKDAPPTAPTSPMLAAVASTEFEELTEDRSAGLSFKISVMSGCPLRAMVSEVIVETGWGA